jgi:hypothetical protein
MPVIGETIFIPLKIQANIAIIKQGLNKSKSDLLNYK